MAREVTEVGTLPRRATRELLAAQSRILARAAAGEHVTALLDPICRLIEDPAAGTICTILLVDGPVLRHGAGPSMPEAYNDAIDGVEWGPDRGSCGTTAHTGLPTIVEDIATDHRWVPWKDLALGFGLRACWSLPVHSRDGRVLATFAAYAPEPRLPLPEELELLEYACSLVSVLLEQQADRDRLTSLTERLERANQELLAASRAKDDFLSMTSHELRTPLTPMLGMLETLGQRWESLGDDERLSLVDVISRQGFRLKHLVDDLLTMSAATAGELRSFPEAVAVGPAVEEAVVMMVGDGGAPVVDVPDGLEAWVDPRHLQQVLQNYLSNAVKYAEGGPRRVVARREGDEVVLRVEDDGDGVHPMLVDRLFELFTQLDRGDRRTARGTGIGLAVVRALAQLNGGRAWYEPGREGGSTFAVALPATDGGRDVAAGA